MRTRPLRGREGPEAMRRIEENRSDARGEQLMKLWGPQQWGSWLSEDWPIRHCCLTKFAVEVGHFGEECVERECGKRKSGRPHFYPEGAKLMCAHHPSS